MYPVVLFYKITFKIIPVPTQRPSKPTHAPLCKNQFIVLMDPKAIIRRWKTNSNFVHLTSCFIFEKNNFHQTVWSSGKAREVFGSNLCRDAGHPGFLCGFPQPLQANIDIVSLLGQVCLVSNSFQIISHQSYDAI
jgi:hypothetical protein